MRYYIVTAIDGHDWLVRASSREAAIRRFRRAGSGPHIRVTLLNGDSAYARYLRDQGQEVVS